MGGRYHPGPSPQGQCRLEPINTHLTDQTTSPNSPSTGGRCHPGPTFKVSIDLSQSTPTLQIRQPVQTHRPLGAGVILDPALKVGVDLRGPAAVVQRAAQVAPPLPPRRQLAVYLVVPRPLKVVVVGRLAAAEMLEMLHQVVEAGEVVDVQEGVGWGDLGDGQ